MKTCCMILLAAFTSLASAQQNDVTSILEVLDVTNGRRTVVKEFPYRVEAPNWTPTASGSCIIAGENCTNSPPIRPANLK